MNLVDPNAGKFGQCGKVLVAGQKLRLEPPHLAGGSGLSFYGLAADDPTHGRITSQTIGIVDVVVSAKTTKDRLAELPDHAMPPILASTAVLEKIPSNLGQAKGIIKLPIGKKPGVRGDLGTVKFQLQTAVEINPQKGAFCFHPPGDMGRVCSDVCIALILIAESC